MKYRLSRLLAGVLAALLALVVCAVTTHAEIVEAVIVKVNGDILTKTELETQQFAVLRARGQQVDQNDPQDAAVKKALDEATPQILVTAVDELLLEQQGRSLGYKLSDDQFNAIVDNIKKQNHIENDEQWKQALAQENVTMVQLREQLEKTMLTQRVLQNEVFDRIAVSDPEAKAYYDSHIQEFTTPPQVTLREILVTVPSNGKSLNVAQDDAAKAKAEALRKRVTTGGEPFEKVASEASEAPSKANAGLIGPIQTTDLSQGIRDLIKDLKPGDITPVFRTDRGYQVLQLVSRTAAVVTPFDKAREQISGRVFTDKRKDAFVTYLDKLRSQAIISWKNDAAQKAYEQGLKEGDKALLAQLSAGS